jgi:hypothetical protein
MYFNENYPNLMTLAVEYNDLVWFYICTQEWKTFLSGYLTLWFDFIIICQNEWYENQFTTNFGLGG